MEGVMRNLKGTYVHRGDVARRTRRIRQTLLVLGLFCATGIIAASRKTGTANAEPAPSYDRHSFFVSPSEARRLQNELASARGQLDLVQAQFDKATDIIRFSPRFDISAGLASSVFDAGISEGVDPELAVRLGRLGRGFNAH